MSKEKDTEIIELDTTYPFFIKFIIALVIIAVVVIAAIFVLNTKFKIRNVEVTGNMWYTDEEIRSALQTSALDKYSIFFKLHYMISKEPEMAFVDKINIKVTSFDTISIKVYEKNIVGCVYEMGDFLYFDKDGYVISNKAEQTNNVPRIEGLDYTSLVVGKKLETSNNKIFDVILALTQLVNKHKILVDAICFDNNFDVTIQCNDGNVIFIGKNDKYDEIMQAIPNILSAAEAKRKLYWINMSEFSPSNTTIQARYLYGNDEEADDPLLPEGEQTEETGENPQ